MKRIALAVAFGLFSVASFGQDVKGLHGWIEDGGNKKIGMPTEAVRRSIVAGAKYVFIDDSGKNVYVIDNPEMVKGHEGHHVAVNGGIDKVAMTVHIASLSMLKNQSPGPGAEAVGH